MDTLETIGLRPVSSSAKEQPLGRAESRLPEQPVTTLQWAVGSFCALLGALMLVAPHQFGGPAYAPLQGVLSWLGGTLIIAGVAVVGCVILGLPQPYVVGAHFLAGGVLLVFGPTFALRGAWNGLALYTILGVGTALSAFVPRAWRAGREHGGDLFGALVGLFSTVNGALILLSPGLFSAPLYDGIRPQLPALGLAFLVAGLAVIVAQLYSARPSLLFRLAHLAILVPFLSFALVDAIPNRIWSGIFFYVGFSLLVASLPWTGPPLRRVAPYSFALRLTFLLALVAALPLIVVMGVVTGGQERQARAEAERDLQTAAAFIASDISHYVGAYRSAIVALAARPGLLALPPAEQKAVLQRFKEAVPEALGYNMFDATGREVARSDDRPLGAVGAGTRELFERVRRTNASSQDVVLSSNFGVPVFALEAPIRAPDGSFGGIVGVIIDSAQVAAILNQFNPAPVGRVYLVDAKGRAIAHPDQSLVASFADLSATPQVAKAVAAADERGVVSAAGPVGEVLAAYARVPDFGWTVVADQPASIALTTVRGERNAAFGLLLGLVLVAAVAGSWLARQLARPLATLSRATSGLARGDSTVALPRGGAGEVQDLVATFGEMRDRLVARTTQLDYERARWQATVDNMLDLVSVCDAAGSVTYINPAYTGLIQRHVQPGLRLEEHPTYYQLYHPDGTLFAAADLPLQRAALRDEDVRAVEIVHRTADGREFVGVFSASPLHDEAGRVIGAVAVGQDVTERKRAEEALRESERKFSLIFEKAAFAAALSRLPDGVLVDVNETWVKTFGYTKQEAVGKTTLELNINPDVAVRTRIFAALRERGSVRDEEMALRTKSGELHIFLTNVDLMDMGGQTYILSTTQDITERKRAEAERERLLVAEQEARRLAEEAVRTRDEFLSVAAHELKTPLTSLRGFAQVVLRQLARSENLDPARVGQAMRQIDRQSQRLANLVNQLLDLSRLENGRLTLEKQPADVAAVVEGAVTLLQHVYPQRDFVLAARGPLLAVVDALRLEQVISNLLDNAAKFSPPGSPVQVAVGPRAGGGVQIVVRDHGPGIPGEKRAHLFERFYQAHEEWHGGLGLGLFISHEIVALHGGSISVACPADGGTCVTVLLPADSGATGE